ncbi:MAG TPA: phenylalanine--tRNA ligase subunit beta [Candidatus Acidoferrales bacterium]|nr:phenylalanine--tRNA ligase subunit beta [Candidatus Acidoferrales bacterium]
MRVPLAWLRQYVELPDDPQAIADRLASLGFPVEEIARRAVITGVVVGKIVALEKHPNADRLQVGQIDVAGEKLLTIATAATNVAVGQVIPVATIGAKLPQLTIEPRKMRGVASEGMMVSAAELDLPADWFEDGIMQLEDDRVLGADVVDVFGLRDAVLDVEITSNRVDAMSIFGLARELAASYGVPVHVPPQVNPGTGDAPPGKSPEVTIASPDCHRFVAQRFENVRVEPAPAWMRIRLALAGQRPINNLVDVSNYVMLETGQPLHFYDADRVKDAHLVVRDARPDERAVTLDDTERTLSSRTLVIADTSDPSQTLCIAGVMGCANSEVGDATNAIILEAANFTGSRVRRISMDLAMRSEASSRHEKNLALALTDNGAARAAQLLVQMGATAFAPKAFGDAVEPFAPILLRVRDVTRILGLEIAAQRIAQHLEALGCHVERVEDAAHGDAFSVVPPPWRRDLTIPADLVEEVARIEGYDKIEPVMPAVPSHDILSTQFDLESRIAHALAGLGYRETITHSLHGADFFDRAMRAGIAPSHNSVEVRNPLSEDQRYLRYAIAPGLLQSFARAGEPLRLFEIGHVFMIDEGHIAESDVLTFGFTADPVDEPAWKDENFLRLKGDCEALLRAVTGRGVETSRDERRGFHPGKTAVLMIDGREVANLGRVDPRLGAAYDVTLPVYLCNIYLDGFPDYKQPRYSPPSKFPSTYRDLALAVAPGVSAAEIERTIAGVLGDLCSSVRAFDEYRGAQVGGEKKSLAVRVVLQRYDATITDAETDEAMQRVLAALRDELGATIRE